MSNEPGKILLVDDSRSVRSQIGAILTDAGFSVATAVDGQEGLELLRQQEFDIVVSDMEMPRLDGLGLCRAIKADDALRRLYFIMLTGREELEAKLQGLDTGADAYIVKTTHHEEFVARIRAGMRIRKLERELAHAQANLFHAEKMASVGQLSAGLAHEINNPIGFISSNLKTLEKYFERLVEFVDRQQQLLPEQAELVELRRRLKIDQILEDVGDLIDESSLGAERIATIVRNLRDFLSIDSYECRPVDLNHCVNLAVVYLQQEFKELKAPFRELTPLPEIRCYTHQINQVLANLLNNAAQAVGSTGEIRITTSAEADEIVLTISDTGTGIPPEHLTRIYDPFFTTRDVGLGAGLGLTIAYDIIRKHGGSIAVESQLGAGTTFTVRLPVQA